MRHVILFLVALLSLGHSDLVIERYSVTVNATDYFISTRVVIDVSNTSPAASQFRQDLVLPSTAFVSTFVVIQGATIHRGKVRSLKDATDQYSSAISNGNTAGIIMPPLDHGIYSIAGNVISRAQFIVEYQDIVVLQLGKIIVPITLPPAIKNVVVQFNVNTRKPLGAVVQGSRDTVSSAASVHFDKSASATNATVVWSGSTQNPSSQPQQISMVYSFEDSSKYDRSLQGIMSDRYFALSVTLAESMPVIPKKVLLVIDNSGSMYGNKMIAARRVAIAFIERLNPRDLFGVVRFDSTVETLVPIGDTTWQRIVGAKGLVAGLEANSGTNIYDAMSQAIEMVTTRIEGDEGHVPIIIFLTDGMPSAGKYLQSEQIVNELTRENGERTKIFTFAISRGSDIKMLKALAYRNSGTCRVIDSDSQYLEQDLSIGMEELDSPQLSSASVRFLPSDAVSSADVFHVTPGSDIFQDGQLVLLGRLNETAVIPESGITAVVTGAGAAGRTEILQVPIPRGGDPVFLQRAFQMARTRVLVDKAINTMSNIAETGRAATEAAIEAQLVTPFTAFVVVAEQIPTPTPTPTSTPSPTPSPVSNSTNGSLPTVLPAASNPVPTFAASPLSGNPAATGTALPDVSGTSTSGYGGYSYGSAAVRGSSPLVLLVSLLVLVLFAGFW